MADDPALAADAEVVDQGAVAGHGLGPDAAAGAVEVVGAQVGDVAAGGVAEGAAAERPDHLADPGAPVTGGHAPEAGPGQGLGQVAEAQVAPAVALPGQGEDGVGADQDPAVDPLGQVDPEERVARVGHRVDEAVDQVAAAGGELVVLAPERHHPGVVVVAGQAGQAVGVQPAADDQLVEGQPLAAGLDGHPGGVLGDAPDLDAGADLGPHGGRVGGQPPGHGGEVDHRGVGRVQGGDPLDVRLQLAQLVAADHPHPGDAVGHAPVRGWPPGGPARPRRGRRPPCRTRRRPGRGGRRARPSSSTPRRHSRALSDPGV